MLPWVATDVTTEAAAATAADEKPTPAAPLQRRLLAHLTWADLALIVVAVGTLERLNRWAFGYSLFMDEIAIALNLRDRGFVEMASKLDVHQSAPLGWLWAQWLITAAFGYSEQVLRFLPMAFSVATLVVAWLIGRRWLGLAGTVTLVGLCAFGPKIFFYADQVKQYSADAFWVLTLTGLAAWVLDQRGAGLRRLYAWWGVAVLASWFSMGAIVIAPALVLVMLVVIAKRQGWRAAVRGALPGLLYLISFGVHYLLQVQYALSDRYIAKFWEYTDPQQPLTLDRLASWAGTRFEFISADPIGTKYPVLFWMLVALGWAVAARYRSDLAGLLIVPVALAWLLAAASIVPLVARLALWIVPALYIAVALAVQAPVWWAAARAKTGWDAVPIPDRWPAERLRALLTGATAALMVLVVLGAAGLFFLKPMYYASARGPSKTYTQGDDRGAIRWISSQHRPGDLLIIGFYYNTSVEWYGDPDALAPHRQVRNWRPGDGGCDPKQFARDVQGYQRVIFYMGAPIESIFPQLDKVVRAQLDQLGTTVESRRFALAQVHVVDLTKKPAGVKPDPVLTSQPKNCLKLYPLDALF